MLRREITPKFLSSLIARIGDENIYKTYLLLSVLTKIDPEDITQDERLKILEVIKPYETADHGEL